MAHHGSAASSDLQKYAPTLERAVVLTAELFVGHRPPFVYGLSIKGKVAFSFGFAFLALVLGMAVLRVFDFQVFT
jgi:hypothetical protein